MYWWQWIFKASYQKWIKLLFVLFCEFQEWTVLLFVIIVPFSFSHSLHSAHIPQYWHSMESSSKYFFFISVHFVYLFCPLGLSAFWQYCEILLESFHWGGFIGHSMCVVKKGNACIKSVFGHSDSVATLCTFVISDELIFTVCIG